MDGVDLVLDRRLAVAALWIVEDPRRAEPVVDQKSVWDRDAVARQFAAEGIPERRADHAVAVSLGGNLPLDQLRREPRPPCREVDPAAGIRQGPQQELALNLQPGAFQDRQRPGVQAVHLAGVEDAKETLQHDPILREAIRRSRSDRSTVGRRPRRGAVLVGDELDRRAVGRLVEPGHGEPRVERLQQDFQTLRRFVNRGHAVDPKTDVRTFPQGSGHRAVGLEVQPFDTIRMILQVGNPDPRGFHEDRAGLLLVGHNADMIELHGLASSRGPGPQPSRLTATPSACARAMPENRQPSFEKSEHLQTLLCLAVAAEINP